MKASELLVKRFEVIKDYPNCPYNVGRILTPARGSSNVYECKEAPASSLISFPEKYPHLFRELYWWEGRTEEQMPKKIISLASKDEDGFKITKQEVIEIKKWDLDIFFGYIDGDRRSGCSLTCWKPEYGYIPVD